MCRVISNQFTIIHGNESEHWLDLLNYASLLGLKNTTGATYITDEDADVTCLFIIDRYGAEIPR